MPVKDKFTIVNAQFPLFAPTIAPKTAADQEGDNRVMERVDMFSANATMRAFVAAILLGFVAGFGYFAN